MEQARSRSWLFYAVVTTLFWGVWGAFIEAPEKAGFPATLGYTVWALTMIPCAAIALKLANWRLDSGRRSIALGLTVGLLGACGQVILFEALRLGPAYLIFPVISLYPLITVILGVALLSERVRMRSAIGIVLAFPALVMLAYQPPGDARGSSLAWIFLALIVFAAWGVQGYVMKFSTGVMSAESLFFYMTLGAVLVIPAAVWMTDFSQPVNWGWNGPWLAAAIQVLNSIGALCLVYALRYGKAIVVVPMTALAPLLTVIISLMMYRTIPHPVVGCGLILASLAIWLMSE